jgi:NAD(P)-dependent dehydrogenase (short-subunit alcohol dehydrogenase family)
LKQEGHGEHKTSAGAFLIPGLIGELICEHLRHRRIKKHFLPRFRRYHLHNVGKQGPRQPPLLAQCQPNFDAAIFVYTDMQLSNKVTIVTGAGRGIGAALARRFAQEGARAVYVVDQDEEPAREVAAQCNGIAVVADVTNESKFGELVSTVYDEFGRIDLFCSNAGIMQGGGLDVTDAQWQRAWEVNFLSHVYAARAVIPKMVEQGGGYLLQTASAAGLLTQIGAAPYSVTKHAAVAFADWLSITYHRQGIRVSCLCSQGVHTRMLDESRSAVADALRPFALTPEQVADAVVEGLADERFLILPHPEVATYFQNKANDNERWLRGMRRLWDQCEPLADAPVQGTRP